jgi:tetratricopeptide (TPR) repeat protein
MCRGFARPMHEREERLSDRDKAVAMRDSPIARTIRGLGVATRGMESRDLKLLERGIEDVRRAKLRMGDNPFVRSASANILMPAAILYGEAGLPDKRKDLLEEAKADVELLKDIPVSEFVRTRVNYLQLEGNDDAALALLKEAASREETKDLVWLLAMTLYGKGQVEQALEALKQSRQPENAAVQMLPTTTTSWMAATSSAREGGTSWKRLPLCCRRTSIRSLLKPRQTLPSWTRRGGWRSCAS